MMKKADVAKVILRTIGAAGLFTALLIAPGLSQGIAIIHKITGRDKKIIFKGRNLSVLKKREELIK
jgi:hypothetical protein